MKQHSIPEFLNELIEVFLHNLIYYVPSELIFHGVLDQLEGAISDDFFDELSLLDIKKGIYQFSNEDDLEVNQRLFEKRSLLENNIFKLVSKNKEVTSIEFQIILERYFDQILFYRFLTEWLTTNLKKYNEDDLNFTLIGGFKLQYENLNVHLNDFHRYFLSLVDCEKEIDFSTEKLVMEYFPDLISKYCQITDKIAIQNSDKTNPEIENKQDIEVKEQPLKKTTSKKEQRPVFNEEEIERMILKSIFKVKLN